MGVGAGPDHLGYRGRGRADVIELLLAHPVFVLPLLLIGGPFLLAGILWASDADSRMDS